MASKYRGTSPVPVRPRSKLRYKQNRNQNSKDDKHVKHLVKDKKGVLWETKSETKDDFIEKPDAKESCSSLPIKVNTPEMQNYQIHQWKNEKIKKLEEETRTLLDEKKTQEQTITNCEEKINNLEHEIEEKQINYDNLYEKYDKIKGKLEKAERKVRDLQIKYDDQKEMVFLREREIEVLKRKVNGYGKQLTEYEKQKKIFHRYSDDDD